MITEFGKALRKLRIDNCEILKNMADKLEMTSSYLSAIECGKRNIPDNLIDKIAKLYHLNEKDVSKLNEAKDNSIKNIEINFDGISNNHRNLALQFARKFDKIDDETTELIIKFLQKNEEE